MSANRHAEDDLTVFELSAGKPGGKRMRPFVTAMVETERWEAARVVLAEVLVLLGVPCWIMAAWPGSVQGRLRAICLGLFGTILVLFVVAIVTARLWRRRFEGCAKKD